MNEIDNIKEFLEKIKNNKDNVIIRIEGKTRQGKSSMSIEIAKYINEELKK